MFFLPLEEVGRGIGWWFIYISFYIIHVHLVHPRPDLVYLVNHCGQAHFWQSVNKWNPNPNFWNSSSKSNLFQQILCFPCSQKGPMDISINPTGKSDLRKKSKNNNQRVAKKDPKKKKHPSTASTKESSCLRRSTTASPGRDWLGFQRGWWWNSEIQAFLERAERPYTTWPIPWQKPGWDCTWRSCISQYGSMSWSTGQTLKNPSNVVM